MPWWGWLLIGLFVGATLGLLTGGLLNAAGQASREEEQRGSLPRD